jgi:hypothetical protein
MRLVSAAIGASLYVLNSVKKFVLALELLYDISYKYMVCVEQRVSGAGSGTAGTLLQDG